MIMAAHLIKKKYILAFAMIRSSKRHRRMPLQYNVRMVFADIIGKTPVFRMILPVIVSKPQRRQTFVRFLPVSFLLLKTPGISCDSSSSCRVNFAF